jgi:hypothetical protein
MSRYADAVNAINPEATQHPKDAVREVLERRGASPKVTDHFFIPGSAGNEAECGVGVPDVEYGRIVGTTCGYPAHEHVQREG